MACINCTDKYTYVCSVFTPCWISAHRALAHLSLHDPSVQYQYYCHHCGWITETIEFVGAQIFLRLFNNIMCI